MIAVIIDWGLTRKSLTVDLLLAQSLVLSRSLPLSHSPAFPVPLLGLTLRVDKHRGSPYAPAITAPLLRTFWSSAPSLFLNIAVYQFLLVGDNLVWNLAMILSPLPRRTLGWSNATVTNHQPEHSSKHCPPTCLEGLRTPTLGGPRCVSLRARTSQGPVLIHRRNVHGSGGHLCILDRSSSWQD